MFSSMNRGGLAGARFELDDRMTAATAAATAAARMNGGKMLCRIDLDDPGTVATLEACARAVDELASHGLIAMVEPFMSTRVDGKVRNDLSPDAVIKSIHIGQGLGSTSAYTWMKLPVVDEMDRVMEATTLPTLLLGGDPGRSRRGVRQLGEGAWAAVGARPDRRPHPAVPGRRRCQLRGRDRRLDGEVRHAQQVLHSRAQRHAPVHRRRHAGVGGLDRVQPAGGRTGDGSGSSRWRPATPR